MATRAEGCEEDESGEMWGRWGRENRELGQWGIEVRYQGIWLERGLGEQKEDGGGILL